MTAKPKYVLNGFPKSGLHAYSAMMGPWCPVVDKETDEWGSFAKQWSGTHMDNSFSFQTEMPRATIGWQLARVTQGRHIRTHMAHYDWIQEYLYNLGTSHVFIYRDLRDVAVSQTHHILERGKHPNKGMYRALGFDGALSAVIEGLDVYEGIIERWEMYAPWLNDTHTLSVSFEDFKRSRFVQARKIVQHGYDRIGEAFRVGFKVKGRNFDALFTRMARASMDTSNSVTFRKGDVGGWRETFTEEHKDLFKKHDNGWLVKLGYEKDENW